MKFLNVQCPMSNLKSKVGKIFKNHNPHKNILLKPNKLTLIFINVMKKNKLIKMGVNIFYLELMFISINFY